MESFDIISDIGEEFHRYRALMEDSLNSRSSLLNAINTYQLQNSGKQLRPILGILSAKACGGTVNDRTISCVAVAELIHTATLLHDDVADKSDRRRGVKTVQAEYTPAASVLTGDYWLSKAMTILVNLFDRQIMEFYTNAVVNLSEGELFQMQKASSLDTSKSDYFNIIYSKTASLFIGAVKSSVATVCDKEEVLMNMEMFAENLGIAFQIRDDIFDYMPSLNTGKPTGGDIVERKLTLPLISALDLAAEDEKIRLKRMLRDRKTNDNRLVQEAFRIVEKYSGIYLAQQELVKYCQRAEKALSFLEESSYKRDLVTLAKYVGERLY